MFGIASHMPSQREFWYAVVEDMSNFRYSLRSVFSNPENQAVDAAEDYHSNHDGWEARWPLTFAIYETEDGPEVGRFTVEREYEPQFNASPVRSASGSGEQP